MGHIREIGHQQDVVLFLGAGFSAYAGLPVMADFAKCAEQELANLHNQLSKPGARLFVEPGETWSLLRERCAQVLDKSLFDPDNIEHLYQFAETLIYGPAPAMELVVSNTNGTEKRKYDYLYIEQMLALWTWKIYHRLPMVDKKRADLRKPYWELFTSICKHALAARTTIITTNYDLVAEFSAAASTDGKLQCSPARNGPVRTSLDPTKVDEDDCDLAGSQDEIRIVKLHGSVDWFTAIIDGQRKLLWADRLDKNADHGDGWKFAALQLNALVKLRRRYGESVAPAIVPPTFVKGRRFDWTEETWRAAFAGLRNARHIIFIGYSLPPSDGHMRGLLAAARASRHDGTQPTVRVANKTKATVEDFAKWFNIQDKHKCDMKFEEMSTTLDGWLSEVASDQQVGS